MADSDPLEGGILRVGYTPDGSTIALVVRTDDTELDLELTPGQACRLSDALKKAVRSCQQLRERLRRSARN